MSGKRKIISYVVIFVLLAVLIFSVSQLFKGTSPTDDGVEDDSESKTIEREGKKYFPRQDLKVFLLMGIDRSGPVEDSGFYRNEGEADMVVLAIFDETAKTYSLLCLNRDTMLKMPTLGLGGKYAGTTVGQLALAHTYGGGLEDSCENTKTAVSDFLYGLEIDYYVSLNMDAVAVINDSVGGVTVNVTDEFPEGSGIPKGEVKLTGAQALTFVRARKDVGDQLNLSRMERQKEYMKGFMRALGEKLDSSESFLFRAYNDVSDLMVTDCSVDTLGSLANRYSDYQFREMLSLEGENSSESGYMEFHADEKMLDDLIIRLFYEEK